MASCQRLDCPGKCRSFVSLSLLICDSIDTKIVLLCRLLRDLWPFLWLKVPITKSNEFSRAVFRKIYFMGSYCGNVTLMLIKALSNVNMNTSNQNLCQLCKKISFSSYYISAEVLFYRKMMGRGVRKLLPVKDWTVLENIDALSHLAY